MSNITASRRSLLNVESAARYLTVSEHFVRRLVRERRITFIKVGRHVRFDPADLDAFIEQGRRAARI
jgi:excisionase family DNA binding protein